MLSHLSNLFLYRKRKKFQHYESALSHFLSLHQGFLHYDLKWRLFKAPLSTTCRPCFCLPPSSIDQPRYSTPSTSVVDPNTLNLDPDWPRFRVFNFEKKNKKKLRGKKFFQKILFKKQNNKMTPEDMFSQFGMWMVNFVFNL